MIDLGIKTLDLKKSPRVTLCYMYLRFWDLKGEPYIIGGHQQPPIAYHLQLGVLASSPNVM